MPPLRRLMSCAAALAVVLALAPSALAKQHSTARTHHLAGVVVAINAKQHTLKLRLRHGAKRHGHPAAARIAAAGATTLVVSCANATVNGPGGAVAVGDDVSVTVNGPLGSTVDAGSITVIGRHNGGNAGRGAAVPGTVVSIDSSSGTLTLAVGGDSGSGSGGSTGDGGPSAQDSAVPTVTVSVDATTILAVGDTNGDSQITLDDISVGDHLVVFTADATTDPIVAVGILDASQPGANRHEGDSSQHHGDSGSPAYKGFNGTVAAVDPPNAIEVTVAGDGPLAGQTVTVDVTSTTHYRGVDGYGSIAVGDQVRVYSQSLDPQPVVAVFIGDGPLTSDSGSPSPNPPSSTEPTQFGGTVTDVRGDGLTVSVTDGPLSGHTVIVAVPASTSFEGVASLDEVAVGDTVEISTANAAGSPVVATDVSDESVSSD